MARSLTVYKQLEVFRQMRLLFVTNDKISHPNSNVDCGLPNVESEVILNGPDQLAEKPIFDQM